MIDWLFGDSGLTPHGYCLIWRQDLIFMHVVSDILISISYFAIPAFLYKIRKINPDIIPAIWAYLFCGFIVSCGITHVFNLITLYYPIYGISGLAKVICALISVTTAVVLAIKHTQANKIPSVNQLMKVTNDLTTEAEHRKKVEEDLKTLTKTLEQRVIERTLQLNIAIENEKKIQAEIRSTMKMREEFLASISHDFKTPLNAILGFSETVMTKIFGDKLNGKNLEYIGLIHKSGSMMRNYINRLVAVYQMGSEADALVASSFEIDEMINNVVDEAQILARQKNIRIITEELQPTLYQGDKILCHSLISNIVSNAVKYTNKGSVCVSLSEIPDGVSVSVKDTGVGIPERELTKIFDLFHRVEEPTISTEGNGLGLAICLSIAKKHGGNITVFSTVGEGSTFIVKLLNQPVDEREESAATVGLDAKLTLV
ncbi:sensor histidine kinase [Kordiimonas pumila]|uniref:histidine kinase n=1 Tax=Kordiimonas pumila TaxID=2161677 RepID=A0ABV7D2C9_9PROT|nr:HAMP domain-containing sensor histidine kinase [Kordiimonas pumila]